jgi:hypothetical protein
MDHGVVVIDGEKPADGTVVEVTPVEETESQARPAAHPAVGIWKDRTDLPDDPVEASRVLRQKLMRRDDVKHFAAFAALKVVRAY